MAKNVVTLYIDDSSLRLLVARGKQHPLTLDPTEHARRKIHDVRQLTPYQFFRFLPLCNARYDGAHPSASRRIAKIHRTLDEFVRFRHEFCRHDHAHANIELRKIVV